MGSTNIAAIDSVYYVFDVTGNIVFYRGNSTVPFYGTLVPLPWCVVSWYRGTVPW